MNQAAWQSDFATSLIDLALKEDLGIPYHDATTSLLFGSSKARIQAKIISKNNTPIVLCGIPLVKAILTQFSEQSFTLASAYKEQDLIPSQAILFTLEGNANTLLMLERTILNFLQRLCAIATFTQQFVKKIQHTKAKILDTRKTLPGFRHLDKYAVLCGGGHNHRMGLFDAIMIKDTHIDGLGSMSAALAKLPSDILQNYPVIVEVRNLTELKTVLQEASHKVTRVLLDNMTLKEMQACVALCQGHLQTEASGNINLENVLEIAECGVDFISIGKLTHSAPHIDLSMKCDL